MYKIINDSNLLSLLYPFLYVTGTILYFSDFYIKTLVYDKSLWGANTSPKASKLYSCVTTDDHFYVATVVQPQSVENKEYAVWDKTQTILKYIYILSNIWGLSWMKV